MKPADPSTSPSLRRDYEERISRATPPRPCNSSSLGNVPCPRLGKLAFSQPANPSPPIHLSPQHQGTGRISPGNNETNPTRVATTPLPPVPSGLFPIS